MHRLEDFISMTSSGSQIKGKAHDPHRGFSPAARQRAEKNPIGFLSSLRGSPSSRTRPSPMTSTRSYETTLARRCVTATSVVEVSADRSSLCSRTSLEASSALVVSS